MRILAYLLLFIFLYRFIVRFVLPLLRFTRTANDRIRQMQQKMNDMSGQHARNDLSGKPPGMKEGDYIEYEEIK